MGIQQQGEPVGLKPDAGMIPWPADDNLCPIPGTSYTLKSALLRVDGRRIRYLGFGGEGYVYQATSTDFRHRDRDLAIKFLTFPGPGGRARLQAFLTESQNVDGVGTHQLAPTLDSLDLRHLPGWPSFALVMHCFPCSLQDIVDAARQWPCPPPLRLAVSWARQIVQGLRDLHDDLQLIHRDLKPSNIMFRLRGVYWMGLLEDLDRAEAVITDFGTLGRRGQLSKLVVCRQIENDPYKHPAFYPLRPPEDSPPPDPQQCEPFMDMYAYGELLRVLARLTTPGGVQ